MMQSQDLLTLNLDHIMTKKMEDSSSSEDFDSDSESSIQESHTTLTSFKPAGSPAKVMERGREASGCSVDTSSVGSSPSTSHLLSTSAALLNDSSPSTSHLLSSSAALLNDSSPSTSHLLSSSAALLNDSSPSTSHLLSSSAALLNDSSPSTSHLLSSSAALLNDSSPSTSHLLSSSAALLNDSSPSTSHLLSSSSALLNDSGMSMTPAAVSLQSSAISIPGNLESKQTSLHAHPVPASRPNTSSLPGLYIPHFAPTAALKSCGTAVFSNGPSETVSGLSQLPQSSTTAAVVNPQAGQPTYVLSSSRENSSKTTNSSFSFSTIDLLDPNRFFTTPWARDGHETEEPRTEDMKLTKVQPVSTGVRKVLFPVQTSSNQSENGHAGKHDLSAFAANASEVLSKVEETESAVFSRKSYLPTLEGISPLVKQREENKEVRTGAESKSKDNESARLSPQSSPFSLPGAENGNTKENSINGRDDFDSKYSGTQRQQGDGTASPRSQARQNAAKDSPNSHTSLPPPTLETVQPAPAPQSNGHWNPWTHTFEKTNPQTWVPAVGPQFAAPSSLISPYPHVLQQWNMNAMHAKYIELNQSLLSSGYPVMFGNAYSQNPLLQPELSHNIMRRNSTTSVDSHNSHAIASMEQGHDSSLVNLSQAPLAPLASRHNASAVSPPSRPPSAGKASHSSGSSLLGDRSGSRPVSVSPVGGAGEEEGAGPRGVKRPAGHMVTSTPFIKKAKDLSGESGFESDEEVHKHPSADDKQSARKPLPSEERGPKRLRSNYSWDKVQAMEQAFSKNQYVTPRDRVILAQTLGLTETQVKVWFQNRRCKQKKGGKNGNNVLHKFQERQDPSSRTDMDMYMPKGGTSVQFMSKMGIQLPDFLGTSQPLHRTYSGKEAEKKPETGPRVPLQDPLTYGMRDSAGASALGLSAGAFGGFGGMGGVHPAVHGSVGAFGGMGGGMYSGNLEAYKHLEALRSPAAFGGFAGYGGLMGMGHFAGLSSAAYGGFAASARYGAHLPPGTSSPFMASHHGGSAIDLSRTTFPASVIPSEPAGFPNSSQPGVGSHPEQDHLRRMMMAELGISQNTIDTVRKEDSDKREQVKTSDA